MLRSLRHVRLLTGFSRSVVLTCTVRKCHLLVEKHALPLVSRYSTAWIPPPQSLQENIERLQDDVNHNGRVRKQQFRSIVKEITALGQVDSLQFLVVLRCCGNYTLEFVPSEKKSFVKDLWNAAKIHGIPLDVSHYNVLLQVYIENNFDFSPTEILLEMKNNQIQPNSVTYEKIIEYFCRKGNVADALKILEHMKAESLSISEEVFNLLIIGHGENGDIESAKNIMQIMEASEIKPSDSTYVALMCAYAKQNNMQAINDIISTCSSQGIHFSNQNFFEVMYTLAVNNHNESFVQMLSKVGRNFNFRHVMQFLGRLVNEGKENLAAKVLTEPSTLFSDRSIYRENVTRFFLRKMALCSKNTENIGEICKQLQENSGIRSCILFVLGESFQRGDPSFSMDILRQCKAMNIKMKAHYFWPILAIKGAKHDFQGILDVLRYMIVECRVTPCFETLKDYVLPYSAGPIQEVRILLEDYGISQTSINCSIVWSFLAESKINKASLYVSRYPDVYNYAVLHRHLFEAFRSSAETKDFIFILCNLHDKKNVQGGKDNADTMVWSKISISEKLLEIIKYFHKTKPNLIENILDELWAQKISITPASTIKICQYLKETLSVDVIEKVQRLSTIREDTETVREQVLSDIKGVFKKAHADNTRRVRSNLVQTAVHNAYKTSDVDLLTDILEASIKYNIYLPPFHYFQMIDTYCRFNMLDTATLCLQRMRKAHPTFTLDCNKILKYMILLIRHDQFDNAINFFMENVGREEKTEKLSESESLIHVMLRLVEEKGTVEQHRKIFDTLMSVGYLKPTKKVLASLVRFHIRRNDLAKAADTFCFVVQKYKSTVQLNALLIKLVENDETELLQKIINTYVDVFKSNRRIYVTLAFVLIECDRLTQAKKLFETTDLSRSPRLENDINWYLKKGHHTVVDKFLKLSIKEVPTSIKIIAYETLLQHYAKENDWQAGINLWIRMQHDDVIPSKEFMDSLAELLRNNGQTIPFSVTANKSDVHELQRENKEADAMI